jgi:DHA3 family macrolide efflux protein-like MFS transporter
MQTIINVSPRKVSSNVLLNRNFMLLFYGKIISQLGDQVYGFALGWYVLDITKSSLQMALFLVIDTLVVALVAPFGGIIADRLNRKKIMVWMDAVRGILVLLVALLLYYHMLQIWMLYVSAIFLGFCGSVFGPAAGAIIPNIVAEEQLTQATSLNNFSGSFCAAVGLIVSGVLYNLIGLFAIFMINGVSYLISGLMEAKVAMPVLEKASPSDKVSFVLSVKKTLLDLQEGFRYIVENKLLLNLSVFNALFSIVAFPALMVLFPYIFKVILKAEPFQLAIAQASGWISIFISSLLAPLFLKRVNFRTSIFIALLTYSICQLLIVPVFLPSLLPLFTNWQITVIFTISGLILGLAIPFIFIPLNVLFQKYTLDQYRGRFWGIQSSLTTVAMPLGYLIAGFLAQRVSMSFLFGGVAAIMFIIALWVVNVKEVRALED